MAGFFTSRLAGVFLTTWHLLRYPLAILVTLLIFQSASPAQDVPPPVLEIPRLSSPPAFEDFLEIEVPADLAGSMARVSDFVQRIPRDGEPATQGTDVYIGYDDQNFYAVFRCFDNDPEAVRARMSPRGDNGGDDWVHIVLDTFHDSRNAYVFSSSALGVQWDAFWTEGGETDANFDTLYYSEGALTDFGYVAWMAIPFESLRFSSEQNQQWGIIFGRNIPRLNEQSYWPEYSSRIEGRLSQSATLEGLDDISSGPSIQLLPFTGIRSFRTIDQRDPARPFFFTDRAATDAGLDAKLVFRDSLVTDIAINPDFSQIESDEPQITTNQRFEVFFPEKRPFFLENASFFQTPIDLVFTRRIADPQFGARLTGKVGPYAIGALLTDDQSPGKRVPEGDPLADKRARFGVLRINRDIFNQSTVGFVFTDRSFENTFNRVGGVDARFKLSQNWRTQLQAATSATRFGDGTRESGPAYDVQLSREGRQFNADLRYSERSAGFVTLTGFNPRRDIRDITGQSSYAFRPEGDYWISMTPGLTLSRITDRDGKPLESFYNPVLGWEFVGQTFLDFEYKSERVRLRPEEARVVTDRDFNRHTIGGAFRTSFIPEIEFEGRHFRGNDVNHNPVVGQEASMQAWSSTDVTLTVRPFTRLSVANRYLFTKLADRQTGATIFNDHIVRSRWNWQFTRELAIRFIVQYDSVLVNPEFTSLEKRKNINTDILFSYQMNAWTALYVGYNGNAQNIDLVPTTTGSRIVRTQDGFINDGRQFFAKFSYLVRF